MKLSLDPCLESSKTLIKAEMVIKCAHVAESVFKDKACHISETENTIVFLCYVFDNISDSDCGKLDWIVYMLLLQSDFRGQSQRNRIVNCLGSFVGGHVFIYSLCKFSKTNKLWCGFHETSYSPSQMVNISSVDTVTLSCDQFTLNCILKTSHLFLAVSLHVVVFCISQNHYVMC